MEDALSAFESTTHSNELIYTIRNFYKFALSFISYETIVSSTSYKLCNNQQPKGVKLKYWFGVAQRSLTF